jgi:hypothetical protein
MVADLAAVMMVIEPDLDVADLAAMMMVIEPDLDGGRLGGGDDGD